MLKKLVAGGPMPADRVDMAADQVQASSGMHHLAVSASPVLVLLNACAMSSMCTKLYFELLSGARTESA